MIDLRDVTDEEYQAPAPRITRTQMLFRMATSFIISLAFLAVVWMIASGMLLLGLRIWGARI